MITVDFKTIENQKTYKINALPRLEDVVIFGSDKYKVLSINHYPERDRVIVNLKLVNLK